MRRLWVFIAALLLTGLSAAPAHAADDYTRIQWSLSQIHAQAAWQVATGSGITVGVVDTGADAGHPDFAGRVSTIDCTNTGGSAGNCRAGGDDRHGHGTHVTGIIAAANDGSGTAGTAPSVNVLVAKVFTCGEPCGPPSGAEPGASLEDIQAGVDWLLSRGVAAINLSLGGAGFAGLGFFCDNSQFGPVLNKIWNAGAVPVFAAGNCGSGLFGGGANYSGVNALVVGATGPTGARASYTNDMTSAQWGLAAPGGDGACSDDGSNCVLSTWPRFKDPNQPYYLLEGTSMAAPHVTGAVADLRAKGLSKEGAVNAIMGALDPLSCGSGCQGRLNMQKALGAPNAAPPAPPPSGNGSFGGAGGTASNPAPVKKVTPKAVTAPVTTVPPTTPPTEPPTTTTEVPTTTTAPRTFALPVKDQDSGIGWLLPGLGVLAVLVAGAAVGVTGWGWERARRFRGGAAP
jgi:subtilisin family serine protease